MSKKIIVITICMMLTASLTFAANELGTMISNANLSAELSNGVSGDYFVKTNANGDPIAFSISTVHAQGNKAYATGSFTTAVYYNPTGDAVDSGDLAGDPGTFDSQAKFVQNWTVVGE